VDPADPYLGQQLIAYIGNKRALLPFLRGVLGQLPVDPSTARFLDPFAGSGAVSRLARSMGFRVAANDWEPYSFVINSCYLALRPSDLPALFPGPGGIQSVVDHLNRLPPLSDHRGYISRHYAPASTESADWRTERLFYTRENALAIDSMRQCIEDLFPGDLDAEELAPQKAALLAPLLYEAATHTNTSGVFKACHKGFGGHGRDALRRIMGPVRLRVPVLCEGQQAEVACMDAAAFLAGRPADVCYLDPPYSIHQYGSNYFMLNTIARWDRPPVSSERTPAGQLREKAGIRPDWVRTRSAFCYRATAAAAMREVVRAADCRWLVVSYSDEGLVGLEEMCDLLSETGSLEVRSLGHARYPGGRQSSTRATRNVELALVVRRGAPARVSRAARLAVADARVARLLSRSFHPSRVRRAFRVVRSSIMVDEGVLLPMEHLWRFPAEVRPPRFTSTASSRAFESALAGCVVAGALEEIEVLVSICSSVDSPGERGRLTREMIRLLNRLGHPKYRSDFQRALELLRAFSSRCPAPDSFERRLREVASRVERRLTAGPRVGRDSPR